MNRRIFLKTIAAGTVSLSVSKSLRADPIKNKTNIIYILADDLGYGDLGCYDQKLIKTPNIDQITVEGMKFTQHYSGSALCAPSRCSLMTGKHTGHCYIRNNKPLPYEGNLPIPAQEITVAEIMKKAGYVTGCIGKWGLGFPGSQGDPNKQGFDRWFGYNCQRLAHNYYPSHLWRNADKVILEGNQNKKKNQYSHDLLTKEALEFIQKNSNHPFFLYLPYTIPHPKLQVPDLGEYADKDWQDNHKIQAAMISRMDKDVGKILAILKKLKIDNHTLVIFTSDNGPHGAAGTLQKFNAAGPLRAKKGTLYEGGIRVPMVARWPGKIEPGSRTEHISAFWDVLPTMAQIAGIDPPADIDGISFLPTLLDQNSKQKQHDYLYWELGGKQTVRKGDFKAIKRQSPPDTPVELYNLKTDLAEESDIAAKHPEIVAQMKKIMLGAHTESKIFPLLKKKPQPKNTEKRRKNTRQRPT